MRPFATNRPREIATCLGIAFLLSSVSDAQQFRPSTLPGPVPVAIPQELLQSNNRHAETLLAQMLRAQQEQGAPGRFAERAFGSQLAYIADQKEMKQTGARVDNRAANHQPRRLPKPRTSDSPDQLNQADFRQSAQGPASFAPPVHVKPNSYSFNDSRAAVQVASPPSLPHRNATSQSANLFQDYRSVGLQDQIAGRVPQTKYYATGKSESTRRQSSTTKASVEPPIRGPIRGSTNQVPMKRNSVRQNQRRLYSNPQVAQQRRDQSDAPTPARYSATGVGKDVVLTQGTEPMLPVHGLVQQVGRVAPAQDPFNDQSMTLPVGSSRPTMQTPRGEYRAVQPPRQISVLSNDPGDEPSPEHLPGFVPGNRFPREGVSPPPVQDNIPIDNASPLPGNPRTEFLPEEASTEFNPNPLEVVLEGADPSDAQDTQREDEMIEPLERGFQAGQFGTEQDGSGFGEAMQDETRGMIITKTCDDFRDSLLSGSIRDIALDISPPASANRDQNVPISRSWTDRNGNVIANGSMVDLRRGYVIIDSAEGRQKIAFAKLSTADWAAVAKYWQIPVPCDVGIRGTATRNWAPQTYTWKASSLCHKPLVFENIQLERYGHSHGPFSQPIRSVGHFFVSFVTWPYQTAIHPSNECQYALGFYRPGDCAPWLKDPIPFSLAGLGRQAIVTGGVVAIP